MRNCLLGLLILLSVSLLWASSKSPVTEIGDHNHDDFIKKNENVIIMFYDPKCPYCKKMLPEFNKAAEVLQERNINVKFGSVNLKQNPKLGDRRGIQYAPTVYYHEKNSESGILVSEHTAVEIINYLQHRFGVYSKLLTTLDETVKFAQLSDATGLYLGDESDPEFTIYRNFLEGYHHLHVSFGHIFNPKLVKELELSSDVKFTIFKKWDQTNADFKDAFTSANLREFINKESHPNVHPVSHKIMRNIIEKKTPFFVLFRKEEHSRSQKAEAAFEEAAMELRKNITFLVAGNKEEEDRHLAELIGVPDASYPQVRIVKPDAKREEYFEKYAYKQETINAKDILQMYEDYKAGTLPKYYKSESIPASNSALLKKVVRDNFDEIVRDETKDVLLEFYTPWCHHCAKIEAMLTGLASQAKELKDFVIARIDISQNDIDDVEISSVPRIYFYPRGKKNEPIKYRDQNNDMQNLLKFLRAYMTIDFKDSVIDVQKTYAKKEDL